MPAKEKMSLQDKKRKLKKLRSLLNTAWGISNDLIGEEDSTRSKNGNNLYNVREQIASCKTRAGFIDYEN